MCGTSETQGSNFQRVAEVPTSSRAAAKEHGIPGEVRKPCLSAALEDWIWTLLARGLRVCLKINMTTENVCPICTISKVYSHYFLDDDQSCMVILGKAALSHQMMVHLGCACEWNERNDQQQHNGYTTMRVKRHHQRSVKRGDESASIVTKNRTE